MSAIGTSPRTDTPDGGRTNRRGAQRRRSTATNASFKATEFFAYLAAVVGEQRGRRREPDARRTVRFGL
jgi:hypothetical protein